MKIVYTLHAKERMEERKIHPTWIEEAIKTPDTTMHKGNRYYAFKKLNGKTIKVVYLKERYIKVITSFFIK